LAVLGYVGVVDAGYECYGGRAEGIFLGEDEEYGELAALKWVRYRLVGGRRGENSRSEGRIHVGDGLGSGGE
jgi:hypothetical protein